MSNILLYGVTIILLLISYKKDQRKTKKALKKAWDDFENILPQFLGIIILVGLLMSVFNADLISKVIGNSSGWLGVILSAVVGSIALIPGFIAFPTADLLLDGGAGYMQIAAFISSLMMVGVVTVPVEIKYFGKRLTVIRNLMAFIFSLIVAVIIGKVVVGI
jgi:uncharacterized membrane protein YraQ (UPF0718 family)